MEKLPKHEGRVSRRHSRFPVDLLIEGKCKYCGRGDLVGGFDFTRTVDEKYEHCCYECFMADRQEESAAIGLARALSGYNPARDREFPLAPEKNTPRRQKWGNVCCDTCGKAIYHDPYKHKLIGAYKELLRGVVVHEKCGVPNR